MNGRVCAVVVTYNRKVLLSECLRALLAQSRAVEEILVVNNASTDGTPEAVAEQFPPNEFPRLRLLSLPKNIGGAGGFREGIKRAFEGQFDWFWVMDDDTIPEPDALSELFASRAGFTESPRPDLLASKVVWIDGSLHPMNISWVKEGDPEQLFLATQHSTLSMRATTFVSLLMHRKLVERYGLPVADYFIWGDDIEYTGRILRHEFGVAVPRSRVTHKTAKKYATVDGSGARFYYHVRNTIWMLTRSNAWSAEEKAEIMIGFLKSLWLYLTRSYFSWSSLRVISTGLRDGFFKRPAQ